MSAIDGVLDAVDDVRSLSTGSIARRPAHDTKVLAEPTFFDREYVINPHMGGTVDRERAHDQWTRLKQVYERRAGDVRVLDPRRTGRELASDGGVPDPADRPDMAFVANHALATADGGGFVLARMATDERAGEPAHFGDWAEREGYEVRPAPDAAFEGMGDALWHPERRLLWAGHGVRSERGAYDELAATLDATVVPLALGSEHYYHLDVAMAPLSPSTVLVQPDAFADAGLAKLDAVFERVLEAPPAESSDGLAVNLEVFDDTVVLGDDLPETAGLLEDAGFDVVAVDTSEFQKAGGSVCCLTLAAGTPT
jgi:N-dimethylarginine dimethylaminohydrolase